MLSRVISCEINAHGNICAINVSAFMVVKVFV